LTAIALAAALKADLCQIYTDVDGVYTADPRIIPDAKKIQEISYDEMLEMAALGSKVMQAMPYAICTATSSARSDRSHPVTASRRSSLLSRPCNRATVCMTSPPTRTTSSGRVCRGKVKW
jgi:acetylglutamate kinase